MSGIKSAHKITYTYKRQFDKRALKYCWFYEQILEFYTSQHDYVSFYILLDKQPTFFNKFIEILK